LDVIFSPAFFVRLHDVLVEDENAVPVEKGSLAYPSFTAGAGDYCGVCIAPWPV
jgi:hypothetical protein